MICVAIIAGVVWILAPSNDLAYADKGFKKAKATIDPEQLRAWAFEEIPKAHTVTNEIVDFQQISNSEVPNYIQKLYWTHIEDALVFKHTNYTNVIISWGGPFFHWMLEIGPTNFVPETASQETKIEWVPGIYYVRESELPFVN